MKNVIISETSLKRQEKLRLGLSFKEKLEVAKKLSELKADIIELGPLSNDKAEEIFIKTVANCVKKTKLAVYGGDTVESVEKTFALLSAAKSGRIIIEVPVSPVYMEYAESKKPKAVLENLITLTEKASSLCKDVEVSLLDATRAEPSFLYQAIKAAITSGAKTVTLTDLAGTMLYCEFYEFIENVKKNVPETENINLTVSCTDRLSTGISNCFACLEAGANGVKLSSTGANGLPTVDAFTLAIDAIGVKKGINVSIDKTVSGRILKQIKSIFSANASTDITSDREENATLGENLKKSDFNRVVKERGYDLSAEDGEKAYAEYLRIAGKKSVTAKDLDVIIASTALQVPVTYKLTRFSVQSSNVLTATANVVLEKDGTEHEGLSFGNGPIDAAFLAIEDIIGMKLELDDFTISSITEGKEAMAETIVRLRYQGKIYSGRGISTDIIGAGIRAYVNAVNKIVYEEKET